MINMFIYFPRITSQFQNVNKYVWMHTEKWLFKKFKLYFLIKLTSYMKIY